MKEHFFTILENYMALTADNKKFLSENTSLRNFNKGDKFVTEGAIAREAAFIVSGIFRYFFTDKLGNEVTTNIVGNNEFISRIDSFTNQVPCDRTIVAEKNSTAVVITRNEYLKVINEIPEYASASARIAADILKKSNEHQRFFIDETGLDSYNFFLSKYPNMSREINLNNVASYIGLNSSTLSRIRKKMKEEKNRLKNHD